MAPRVAAEGLPPLAHDEGADLGERPLPADRLPGDRLLLGARRRRRTAPKSLDEVDPKLLETYEKLGIPLRERAKLAGVAVDAVFDCVSVATTFREQAREGRHHLLLLLRGGPRAPGAREEVPRLGRARTPTTSSPTLNSAVFSDGSFCYIPKGVRCPMELSTYFRINAANTGQFERTLIVAEEGAVRQLPRGLHGPDARREPAPRRGRRARRARQRRDQVLDRPELVPRRQGRQGRHLQLRHQARRVPRPQVEDLLDAGRDRLRDHLEVPELHPAGRRLGRRVLLGGADQQPPAGRHRHEDDPHRQEHRRPRSSRRASRPATARTPTAAWSRSWQGRRRRAQLLAVRLAADRRQVRRPHVPLHRGPQLDRADGARGLDLEDRRGPDLLLPAARHLAGGRGQHDRQRLLQGGLQGAARWSSPSRRRSCSASAWKGAWAK